MFSVFGTAKKLSKKVNEEKEFELAIPLVYTLLTSKESSQYAIVLRSAQAATADFNIQNFKPERFMTVTVQKERILFFFVISKCAMKINKIFYQLTCG